VDATTKFQWEAIKTLATKAQEVEDKAKAQEVVDKSKAQEVEDKAKAQEVDDKDKGKTNVMEVEDDDWGDDELLFDFESE
jgi:hypothetical protein